MLKVRLQGLPKDMNKYIKDLKKHYDVLSVSEPYKNRNSQYVRVYVELIMKDKD